MWLLPLVPVHAKTAPFDSGSLTQAQSWIHPFDDPGRFTYHCVPHPFMKGVLDVTPKTEPPNVTETVRIVGNRFVPETLQIPPGANVTWRNEDAAVHTVTQDDEPAGRGPGKNLPLYAALWILAAVGGFVLVRHQRSKP